LPFCITNSQCQVLQSVSPIKYDEVVIGQYEGYKDDPTVPDDSNTPTFASVVLRVHNERWEGQCHLKNHSLEIPKIQCHYFYSPISTSALHLNSFSSVEEFS
jgi:hypothetical protein